MRNFWGGLVLAGLVLLCGGARADSIVVEVGQPGVVSGPYGARIFLGYDEWGRLVYSPYRLTRQILGFDRYGRPVYGCVYNNRPVFLRRGDFALIVRPYGYDWFWERHREWSHRHRPRHGEWERHERFESGHDSRDFGHEHFDHDRREFGHEHFEHGHHEH